MLTKPSFPVWLLCVAGGAFGVLAVLHIIPVSITIAFWVVTVSLALLVLACLLPML